MINYSGVVIEDVKDGMISQWLSKNTICRLNFMVSLYLFHLAIVLRFKIERTVLMMLFV